MQLPEHIKIEIWNGFWTRQDAVDNPDKLFLFGDNIFNQIYPSIPRSTQAVIRGLPNAWGICTKLDRHENEDSYLSDTQNHIDRLKRELNELYVTIYHNRILYKTIVLPKDGIGTGKAKLKEKAPKCWELLQEFLAPLYERAEQNKN